MPLLNSDLIASELSTASLSKLFDGDALAIRVPQFYDAGKCVSVSSAVYTHISGAAKSSGKIYLSDLEAFYNVAGNREKEDQYLACAVPGMAALRRIASPNVSPSDLLRARLDEEWPDGAKLLRLRNRAMLFGITRVWPEGSEGLPHQDFLLREIPGESSFTGMQGQLGANIYLGCAETGGELELWDHTFTSKEVHRLGVQGSYGFNRSDIPTTSIRLVPSIGDLIIINTMKVHAISKILKGTRVTISGFIGHWSGRPLGLWS